MKKYLLNECEIKSLVVDVKTKQKQIQTFKENVEKDIISIESEISKLNKYPNRRKKETRKLFKLNNKLKYKNKSLSKDIVFGGKKLLSEISYLSNNKEINSNKLKDKTELFKQNRISFIYLLGEANQKGNRFFNFDFENNKKTYKPNRNTKIEIIFSNYKSYKKELALLEDLANSKSIAITIRLSDKHICLSFDDKMLYGHSINEKERKKDVIKIKNENISEETIKEKIKTLYKSYFKEQETKQLSNKKSNRYLSIDTNPDYIGCSILDKVGDKIKIIHTFSYDLTNNNLKLPRSLNINQRKHLNNKRKHGIYHIWKDLFETFQYYKCGYLVLEDLNIKTKDLGNKTSNRKVNNVWYRDLSNNLIQKYCNKLGIIKIEINPCYSSFIGNLMYDYIDPVNAAIEIGRRGIFKYIKNSFYPPMNLVTIMNTMSKRNALRDVSFLKDESNWVGLFAKAKESGLRYRTTLKEDKDIGFNVVNKLNHSNILKYCFI